MILNFYLANILSLIVIFISTIFVIVSFYSILFSILNNNKVLSNLIKILFKTHT